MLLTRATRDLVESEMFDDARSPDSAAEEAVDAEVAEEMHGEPPADS